MDKIKYLFYRLLCLFNRHADIYESKIKLDEGKHYIFYGNTVSCGICGKSYEYYSLGVVKNKEYKENPTDTSWREY